MAAIMEAPKISAVTVVIEKTNGLIGFIEVALKAAKLLPITGNVEVIGLLPGKSPFIKLMGGGDDDEELAEHISEITSLLHTLEGWMRQAERGENLEVTISVVA